jgi:hypothetical protein
MKQADCPQKPINIAGKGHLTCSKAGTNVRKTAFSQGLYKF